MRERGLKLVALMLGLTPALVAPHAGAWVALLLVSCNKIKKKVLLIFGKGAHPPDWTGYLAYLTPNLYRS